MCVCVRVCAYMCACVHVCVTHRLDINSFLRVLQVRGQTCQQCVVAPVVAEVYDDDPPHGPGGHDAPPGCGRLQNIKSHLSHQSEGDRNHQYEDHSELN